MIKNKKYYESLYRYIYIINITKIRGPCRSLRALYRSGPEGLIRALKGLRRPFRAFPGL